MIASLFGIIDVRDDPYIVVDVQGVGYRALVSQEVLTKAAQLGNRIKLFTYTYVREDALDLYGFLHREDLKLFELLIGVSGVGPKTAMGIFSIGTRSQIIQAIVSGDSSFFVAVPRLGKKNAQKIIIELKSKLGSTQDVDLSDHHGSHNEIIAALSSFGFTQRESQEALLAIQGRGETTAEKVKLALRYLGK